MTPVGARPTAPAPTPAQRAPAVPPAPAPNPLHQAPTVPVLHAVIPDEARRPDDDAEDNEPTMLFDAGLGAIETFPSSEERPTKELPALKPARFGQPSVDDVRGPALDEASAPGDFDDVSDVPKGGDVVARPAALWRRAIAGSIDLVLVGAVVGLYFVIASMVVGGNKPLSPSVSLLDDVMVHLHAWQGILLPGALLAAVLAVAYSVTFVIVWNGATPGRRLVGIQLVDMTGQAPRPARAVIRALLSLVSAAICLGGFWLALFDRRGQTLHDKLTRTVVVQLL